MTLQKINPPVVPLRCTGPPSLPVYPTKPRCQSEPFLFPQGRYGDSSLPRSAPPTPFDMWVASVQPPRPPLGFRRPGRPSCRPDPTDPRHRPSAHSSTDRPSAPCGVYLSTARRRGGGGGRRGQEQQAPGQASEICRGDGIGECLGCYWQYP